MSKMVKAQNELDQSKMNKISLLLRKKEASAAREGVDSAQNDASAKTADLPSAQIDNTPLSPRTLDSRDLSTIDKRIFIIFVLLSMILGFSLIALHLKALEEIKINRQSSAYLTHNISILDERIAKLDQGLLDLKTQMDLGLDGIQNSIMDNKGVLNQYENQVTEKLQQLDNVKAEFTSMEFSLKEAKSEIDGLSASNGVLQTMMNDITSSLEQLKSQQDELAKQITAAQPKPQ